jgi:transcriptional regulator with XRE-family HTH domain
MNQAQFIRTIVYLSTKESKQMEKNVKSYDQGSIGGRLRAERERINMTQAEMATIAGLTKQAQINYESNKRSPDLVYLSKLAERAPIDVSFIVTGKKNTDKESLTNKEVDLIEKYRSANKSVIDLVDYILDCHVKQEKLQQELQDALGVTPIIIPPNDFSI